MKPEEQIKALSELDGVRWCCADCNKFISDCTCKRPRWKDEPADTSRLKPYLKSYNEIIPLIQKQSWNYQLEVAIQLRDIKQKSLVMIPTMDNLEGWCAVMLASTPAQLCEALLRATGKWKE